MKKEKCKSCDGTKGYCPKCLGNGYFYTYESKTNQSGRTDFSNKPKGTHARDGFNYGL